MSVYCGRTTRSDDKSHSLDLAKSNARTATIQLKYIDRDRILNMIDRCITINQVSNVMTAARKGRVKEYELILDKLIENCTKLAEEKEELKNETIKVHIDRSNLVTIKVPEHLIQSEFKYTFEPDLENGRLYFIRHILDEGYKYESSRSRFRFKLNNDAYKEFVGEYPTVLYVDNGNQRKHIKLKEKI